MKFIGILLSIAILVSCQPQQKQGTRTQSDETSKEEVAVNMEDFKEYFQRVTLTADTFHIHHYRWATGDEDFKGQLIVQKILKQYVDSTIFKANFDEEYFAIAYIKQIDAFLIRTRMSEADHMQQLFLLNYNADKQAFTSATKVASFFGAEGFINQMASWIVPNNNTYQVFMRNSNWSIDVVNETETETDSIRTYIFYNHQFTPKSTVKTSKALKKQFPLVD